MRHAFALAAATALLASCGTPAQAPNPVQAARAGQEAILAPAAVAASVASMRKESGFSIPRDEDMSSLGRLMTDDDDLANALVRLETAAQQAGASVPQRSWDEFLAGRRPSAHGMASCNGNAASRLVLAGRAWPEPAKSSAFWEAYRRACVPAGWSQDRLRAAGVGGPFPAAAEFATKVAAVDCGQFLSDDDVEFCRTWKISLAQRFGKTCADFTGEDAAFCSKSGLQLTGYAANPANAAPATTDAATVPAEPRRRGRGTQTAEPTNAATGTASGAPAQP